MADDERRAEIEAVARAMWDARESRDPSGERIGDRDDDQTREAVFWDRAVAEDLWPDSRRDQLSEARLFLELLVRPLDRIRDARDDDEADPIQCGDQAAPEEGDWPRATRSPQGEDHDELEAAYKRGYDVGRIDEKEAAIQAGVFRHGGYVSPSRDGTVAVEDIVQWLYNNARQAGIGTDERFFSVKLANDIRAEFSRPATGEQTDHGGNQ